MSAQVTPTSSPVEIDTRLKALWHAMARHEATVNAPRITADQREAIIAAHRAAQAEAAPLEQAYNDRRWTRWYWVPRGHVHDNYHCPTLYVTTERHLDPTLSGSDEAAAVGRWGWRVCTICAPSATVLPAYRTAGTYAAEQASVTGDCLNLVPAWRDTKWGRVADCGVCEARGLSVTSLGNLRKHKHQRNADDAARAARINDPKLIGAPGGDELVVDRDTLRTLIAAERAYMRHLQFADWAGNPDEHRAHAETIAVALAAKAGCTVGEIHESMAPRVAKAKARSDREAAKHAERLGLR